MERLSIAIIHDSTLVSAGLYKILNDMFNIKPHCYNIDSSALSLDYYDIYIISSELYSINADIFTPKKQKCILVTQKEDFKTEKDNVISQFWSEDRIIDVISKNITRLDEIKTSQNELSKREIDVLKLIVKGCLNKEIANTLNISVNTVLTHRKNITSKLGIKSVSGLSVYAMMNGLI